MVYSTPADCANADEEQVRDHYDRGDDFYAWFLGPRMIYTSGIISDINKEETLETYKISVLGTRSPNQKVIGFNVPINKIFLMYRLYSGDLQG